MGHRAISLPLGRDRDGLPFRPQIVEPRGDGAKMLAVAAALESLLAGDPLTARAVPDIAKLKPAPKLADNSNFLGFDEPKHAIFQATAAG